MNSSKLLVIVAFALAAGACTSNDNSWELGGQDIHLTLLHTTDIHSRLIPYDLQVGEVDARLGLAQSLEPFGGAARLAYIVARERERAGRVLYLDSGDISQGAPIYNYFSGEPEMRYLNQLHTDAMVIGNHEFDTGGINLYEQLDQWSTFPALSANYLWEDPELPYNSPLGGVSQPYVILNAQGLRVAVIGLANLSSMNSIYDTSNRLGITPLDPVQTAQYYVDMLRPLVDLVVVNAHMGLTADEELLEDITDVDILVGGHHHVVLNPPKQITDPSGRQVIMSHSGGFAKYVGRLDVVLRQCHRIPECVARYTEAGEAVPDNDWEVVSSEYDAIPLDSTVPEDPFIATMLEGYVDEMNQAEDLTQLIGYAPATVRRFGTTGGDSQLGNLVATAILLRQGVQTDFALTNTLGIRADFVPGPVSVEQMYNVFPFENTIATLYLSGAEVQEMFDFIAHRSAGRGCATQAQIAGSAVTMACGPICPIRHRQADGSCAVDPEPAVERVLIGDASPAPTDSCRAVQRAFDECCNDVLRCGCDDDVCLDSECERRARQAHSGCSDSFEPNYSTDPCGDDAECIARDPNQRCFIPSGQEYGRCMFAVIDEFQLLDPYGAYELAANDYIARGGSGFRVLGRNTTAQNLGISLREAAVEYIRAGDPCTDNDPCTDSSECSGGQMCACDEAGAYSDASCFDVGGDFASQGSCPGGTGHCVLAACVTDLARYRGERINNCDGADVEADVDQCYCRAGQWAMAECQILSCIDARMGAVSDGRQRMVQP